MDKFKQIIRCKDNMKQIINNCLKINQLLKYTDFSHALFKQKCLLCASSIDTYPANLYAVCASCLNDLPWHAKTSCPQCGLASNGSICGSCISSPPDFDATHAVFEYGFPIDAMIQRYKYDNMQSLSQTFGQFLSEKTAHETIDLIIPMPMHPTRLKQRGFNQALEIARVLDRYLTLKNIQKLDYKSVIRQTLTPPQASLPLKQRVKNIKGAFKVNGDRLNQFQAKRVAIVDDVMTTGASLNELAKTLKKAGAAHVECWVIARTLPHQ